MILGLGLSSALHCFIRPELVGSGFDVLTH